MKLDLNRWALGVFFSISGGVLVAPSVRAAAPVRQLANHPFSRTSYAITADGELYAWGFNAQGQLGDGTMSLQRNEPAVVPRPPGVSAWSTVAANAFFTVAITDDRRLFMWGWNGANQFGLGDRTNRFVPTPVPLPAGVAGWNRIAVGGSEAVMVATTGTMYSTAPSRLVPVPSPPGVTDWLSIAAGGAHYLAVGNDGNLYGWGSDESGQLGLDGGTIIAPTRLDPIGGVRWAAVAAGSLHSLALTEDGRLFGWGWNSYGQLGNPQTGVSSTLPPTQVPLPEGATRWTSVLAGSPHTLAFGDNGRLYGFGANGRGELGLATNTVREPYGVPEPTPLPLPPGANRWTMVSAGEWYTLGVAHECNLFAWGDNSYGQLGIGEPSTNRYSPSAVTGLGTICGAVSNAAPLVLIAAPQEGEKFFAPADIVIVVHAEDVDGVVQTVEFFAGVDRLGVVTNDASALPQPRSFQLDWTNAPPGEYQLTAKATDGAGATSVSALVRVSVLANPEASVSIVAEDPLGVEGSTNALGQSDDILFTVSRTGLTNAATRVRYAVGGTASNGVDYVGYPLALSGEVTLPPGARSVTIRVTPLKDDEREGIESVVLSLIPPTNGSWALGWPRQAAAVLADLDAVQPPFLYLPDGAFYFVLSATNGARFRIEASADLRQWSSLGTMDAPDRTIRFVDPEAPGYSQRFYRAVAVDPSLRH